MKDFKSLKNEIYKCSKCGLCQSVCPVYKYTLDESCVSRGKFILLNGILNGDIELSKELIKDFDKCTSCNACADFCPSGINAAEIFAAFKNYCSKKQLFTPVEIFEFKLKLLSALIKLYSFFKADKITSKILSSCKTTDLIDNFINFANSLLKSEIKIEHKSAIKKSEKIVYFKGCFNKYVNPQNSIATENLFKLLGYDYLEPDFCCCAISKYFDGDFTGFEKNAKKIISKIPKDTDYIICDCATCVYGISKYPLLFQEAEFLKNKIISIEQFLQMSDFEKVFPEKIRLTYHKPCHSADYSDFIKTKFKNIDFVEIEQSCCGFAGEFSLKHPVISSAIGQKKASEIINSGADVVITSCPSCAAGLKKSLIQTNIKVLMLSELLNLY